MKVVKNFDPESSNVTFTVTSNLLRDYSSVFEESIKSYIKGCTISYSSTNTAIVSFVSVEMRGGDDKFVPAINSFIKESVSKKILSTEFIPLDGYPVSDIEKDIVEALKNKRDLCIIKDYDEFLSNRNRDNAYIKYTQRVLKYRTVEYSRAIVMIRSGEFEEFKKMYKDRLVLNEWI